LRKEENSTVPEVAAPRSLAILSRLKAHLEIMGREIAQRATPPAARKTAIIHHFRQIGERTPVMQLR
jgi:hypothetical protein